MASIGEIIKKLREAKKLEVGEDETKRIRITVKNGKADAVIEVVPDLDSLSLDQLYTLQEEYETRFENMNEAAPDEDQDPVAYESWEEALDLLEQDLEDVNSKIEELEEEEGTDEDE